MGLLRIMMPPKLQLLAVVAFAVAMLFLENQIQKLEESRAKLGEAAEGLRRGRAGGWALPGVASDLLQGASESPESWDPGTSSSRLAPRLTSCTREVSGQRGCPVGPPRRGDPSVHGAGAAGGHDRSLSQSLPKRSGKPQPCATMGTGI